MFELVNKAVEKKVLKVIGVGGLGANAVHHMLTSGINGVEFYCANTDAHALRDLDPKNIINLGGNVTKDLGAGANPEISRQAAMEDRGRIAELLNGADMVLITAGMGGGTGTGGAPVVAQAARELGILTVAVVTRPFAFEGDKRMKVAEAGLKELSQHVDSLITIPNEKLLTVLGKGTSLPEAFAAAIDVLLGAVQGIADLIIRPGMINVDFADVRTVMSEMGMAMMGTGVSTGENRAREAAERAIKSPLLEDINLQGARGILVNITAGSDLSLGEFSEVGNTIEEFASDAATVVVGTVIDPDMGDELKVTVVATGLGAFLEQTGKKPVPVVDGSRVVNPVTEYAKFDKPAFIRGNTQKSGHAKNNTALDRRTLDEKGDDYLEIPFFLRRSADGSENLATSSDDLQKSLKASLKKGRLQPESAHVAHSGETYDQEKRFPFFRAFYPQVVECNKPQLIMLYIFCESLTYEIESLAKYQFSHIYHQRPISSGFKSQAEISRGTTLNISLQVPGISVALKEQSVFWDPNDNESKKKFELAFPFIVNTQPKAQRLTGDIVIFSDGIAFGRIPIVLICDALSAGIKPVESNLVKYKDVFVSYSRKDSKYLSYFKSKNGSKGERFLIDVEQLRSGDVWKKRLKDLVYASDAFQLLWSKNSAKSAECRDEWHWALDRSQQISSFLQPIWWKTLFRRKLVPPPKELNHLHFQLIDLNETEHREKKNAREPATPSGILAWLTVVEGPSLGKRYPIGPGLSIMTSDPIGEIRIDHELVIGSRHLVIDWDSKNCCFYVQKGNGASSLMKKTEIGYADARVLTAEFMSIDTGDLLFVEDYLVFLFSRATHFSW